MSQPAPFRQIGKGFCGSVWAADRDGPTIAMKREDGGPLRSVTNDSKMHIEIESALQHAQSTLGLATQVNVPRHHALISANDLEWWEKRKERFPEGMLSHFHSHISHANIFAGYEACNTLLTERILPLRREVRERVIERFCHEQTKQAVRTNRQDEDCLLRPYLGRRNRNATPKSRFFTLRNKPLYIDQMESISLPVEGYAKAMAETLAVVYWHAKVDANDMEFVIAPGREGDEITGFKSKILGQHALWILDFDCVREMAQDEAGIEQAAKAYLRNDPFWPRPGGEEEADKKLWKIFRERFLEASVVVFGEVNLLPKMFIDRLEALGQERRENVLALRKKEDQEEGQMSRAVDMTHS